MFLPISMLIMSDFAVNPVAPLESRNGVTAKFNREIIRVTKNSEDEVFVFLRNWLIKDIEILFIEE